MEYSSIQPHTFYFDGFPAGRSSGPSLRAIGSHYRDIGAAVIYFDGADNNELTAGLLLAGNDRFIIGITIPSLEILRRLAKLAPEIQLATLDDSAKKWFMKKDIEVVLENAQNDNCETAMRLILKMEKTAIMIEDGRRISSDESGFLLKPAVLQTICSALNRFNTEEFMSVRLLEIGSGSEVLPSNPLLKNIIHLISMAEI